MEDAYVAFVSKSCLGKWMILREWVEGECKSDTMKDIIMTAEKTQSHKLENVAPGVHLIKFFLADDGLCYNILGSSVLTEAKQK